MFFFTKINKIKIKYKFILPFSMLPFSMLLFSKLLFSKLFFVGLMVGIIALIVNSEITKLKTNKLGWEFKAKVIKDNNKKSLQKNSEGFFSL